LDMVKDLFSIDLTGSTRTDVQTCFYPENNRVSIRKNSKKEKTHSVRTSTLKHSRIPPR